MTTIAALYVQHNGAYYDISGVEPWGLPDKDAREYAGPHPVVAHPPCSRWCRLAGLVEARWGHKKGEDGGCFEAALGAVREFGGVLEHPAYSDAWNAFGLNRPPTGGGWVNADFQGGWTCYIEQGRYGHPAKKATWLYACKPLALMRQLIEDFTDPGELVWDPYGGSMTTGVACLQLGRRFLGHSRLEIRLCRLTENDS